MVNYEESYLNELRLQMIAGHQVGQLQVEIDAHSLGGHHYGTAWSGSGKVVQIDRHIGCLVVVR